MLALPGLIDAHAHSDQALLRGAADGLPWKPFLLEIIWPLLAQRSQEDARVSLKLCMLEMIKSGTTCFVDSIVPSHYDFDGLAQTVVDMGMRAVLGKYVLPDALFERDESIVDTGGFSGEEESLADAERGIAAWHGAAGAACRSGLGLWCRGRSHRPAPRPVSTAGYRGLLRNMGRDHRTFRRHYR